MKTYIVLPNTHHTLDGDARLEEAVGLARAINLDVVYKEIVNLREIKPSTYFGKGILERLKPQMEQDEAGLLIVDTHLSPIQQRNLEKELNIKVIDRTALILEIFGERATTKEGTLQVELAHLTYQKSRLVRSWTHLERQRGGGGFLGGPGEKQMELDRRNIDDKIVKIKKELDKVKKTRDLQRSARKKVPYPIVTLVGYTNAGKSSLFNYLAKENIFAENLLFATLDPTMRKIRLKSGTEVILSDTVGFISDLPHELVMAFRATLEEVLEADILVHVRDIANPEHRSQKQDVLKVLDDLGLKQIEHQKNYIEVLNKIDLLEDNKKQGLERGDNTVAVSAITGEGVDDFLKMVDKKLSLHHEEIKISVKASDGKTLAWIHQNAEVLESKLKNQTMFLTIKIDKINQAKLEKLISPSPGFRGG